MIAAASENNTWKNNELVWRLPNDFKGSRTSLRTSYYIMGRKHSKVFPNHYLTEHIL
jgi:hypothetical protein